MVYRPISRLRPKGTCFSFETCFLNPSSPTPTPHLTLLFRPCWFECQKSLHSTPARCTYYHWAVKCAFILLWYLPRSLWHVSFKKKIKPGGKKTQSVCERDENEQCRLSACCGLSLAVKRLGTLGVEIPLGSLVRKINPFSKTSTNTMSAEQLFFGNKAFKWEWLLKSCFLSLFLPCFFVCFFFL